MKFDSRQFLSAYKAYNWMVSRHWVRYEELENSKASLLCAIYENIVGIDCEASHLQFDEI